jgi:hypothetical protein
LIHPSPHWRDLMKMMRLPTDVEAPIRNSAVRHRADDWSATRVGPNNQVRAACASMSVRTISTSTRGHGTNWLLLREVGELLH